MYTKYSTDFSHSVGRASKTAQVGTYLKIVTLTSKKLLNLYSLYYGRAETNIHYENFLYYEFISLKFLFQIKKMLNLLM